jgi:predicted GNAT superfamily acetyltransferase
MLEIVTPTSATEMTVVVEVFEQVWGQAVFPNELLVAVHHSGGYVSVALGEDGNPIGASVGLLGRYLGAPSLHSHVTALVPSARGAGLGRAIKMHQRSWAAANDLDVITWTFDPLVRRNAWFNIAVLGAEAVSYLPSFYGSMTDAVNVGDESDRLLMVWNVHARERPVPLDGSDATGEVTLVPTPADVVALRRTDPAEVAQWRVTTRRALTSALATGQAILGFTRAGEYVIGSAS